jgi:hypothetical protein
MYARRTSQFVPEAAEVRIFNAALASRESGPERSALRHGAMASSLFCRRASAGTVFSSPSLI